MTRWVWMDIYGNLHEALMGILWLFASNNVSPSQCLTSTGKGFRPLSSLHRCVLLLQLFWCCGLEGSECAGVFLAAVARLFCVQIIGESKQCLFACIHIEEPQHHGNVQIQTLAVQLRTTFHYDTEFLIKGISPGMRVTATQQRIEWQYLKLQTCRSKTRCHLLSALSSQKSQFI